MSVDDGHVRVTYQEIHRTIAAAAKVIREGFKGFFPARVLRTFLKTPAKKNIPIQAVGLALYEDFGTTNGVSTTAEKLGKEVVRTQWLDFSTLGNQPLLGRKILIVDEVDDTRTTLSYAVAELEKDVQAQLEKLSPEARAKLPPTEFAVFVVHNKLKPKAGSIPERIKYFPGANIEDRWVDYPWEMLDIDTHDQLAAEQKKLGLA